jgi:hypothetical protein
MELSTAQQVLVIILSTVLAISLILSIVIGVMVIQLVRRIQQMVDKAERAVASVGAVSEAIKSIAGPASLLRAVKLVVNMVSRHNK